MMLSVNWDVSPVIFNIGSFQLRYYGVLFIIGFYLGYYMFRYFFRRENKPLELLDTLLWTLMICTIVGARLGHVLFYQPDYYLANPLEILKVWHGGLASHGGTIAIMIGMWWFVKKYGRKHNFGYIWLLDRLAVATAFAAMFIRLGNLMNSEIYGEPTTLPWGFKFVRDYPIGMPIENIPACHPTQIYEAIFCILVFIYLLFAYYKQNMAEKRPGFMFGIFLIVVFGSRIAIEFIKNPQVEFETSMTLDMGQWLSIPFLLAGIYCVFKSFIKK